MESSQPGMCSAILKSYKKRETLGFISPLWD